MGEGPQGGHPRARRLRQLLPRRRVHGRARLNYRDGKPKYLEDTPRFIQYVRKTARRYIQLSPLTHLIDDLEGSETSFGYTF